jgi:hypothetical protein
MFLVVSKLLARKRTSSTSWPVLALPLIGSLPNAVFSINDEIQMNEELEISQ